MSLREYNIKYTDHSGFSHFELFKAFDAADAKVQAEVWLKANHGSCDSQGQWWIPDVEEIIPADPD